MSLVKVKITGTVITAKYGTLSAGDVLATDEAFAKHLVTECGAAKYLDASQPASQQKTANAKRKT